MDLNPQILDWTRAHGPYELASHCLANNANILILLNAWLDSKKEPAEAHDWYTLDYWAARLFPLWTDEKGVDPETGAAKPSTTEKEGRKETVVVICNRNGEENG